MSAANLVLIIGAITALVVSLATLATAILSLLTFFANAKRDKLMEQIHQGVNGLSHEAKDSALGQAAAEVHAANLEGRREGIEHERANPMVPTARP
jgi:hypothetical protein